MPYIYGKPVPPDQFVGRREIIERILNVVRNFQVTKGQHFLLPGPRRIGKTSVLLFLEQVARNEGRATPLFIDCSGVFSLEDLYKVVSEKLLTRLGKADKLRFSLRKTLGLLSIDKISIGFPPVSFDISVTRPRSENVATIVSAAGKAIGSPLLFLLDESTWVTEVARRRKEMKEFNEFTREISENAILVAAFPAEDLYGLSLLFPSGFQVIRLGPFDRVECREVISTPASEYGVSFTSEAIDTVYSLTNGFPYHVQLLSYHAVSIAKETGQSTVTENTICQAFSRIGRYFVDEIYNEVRSLPTKVNRVVASLSGRPANLPTLSKDTNLPSGEVSQVVDYLMKFGYLVETKPGLYSISNKPLLQSVKSSKDLPRKPSPEKIRGQSEESRVFIGGNYDFMADLRQITKYIEGLGLDPILAYDYDVPKDKIYETDLKLLHRCRYAIFEVTAPNGQHYEIPKAFEWNVKTYLVYQVRDQRRKMPPTVTSMLTTFNVQGKKPRRFGYVTFDELKAKISEWLVPARGQPRRKSS